MATLDQIYDSLPYIDKEPSQAERARIIARLKSDIPADARDTLHPSLPTYAEPTFSIAVQDELKRVAAGEKLKAIDSARYQNLDPPEDGSDSSAQQRERLRRAYGAHTYLSGREGNLALLEENGRNSWLIGNLQLEQDLKAVERQLTDTREEIDATNRERKAAQEAARGELEALEDTWRKGVGRILEAEVATERLRQESLTLRRQGATG